MKSKVSDGSLEAKREVRKKKKENLASDLVNELWENREWDDFTKACLFDYFMTWKNYEIQDILYPKVK